MCPFKLNESYCAVLPCDILCFWTAVSKHFIKCWDFFSLSQSIQFELGWALLGVASAAVGTCGHLCPCSIGNARVHLRRCNSNKKGNSFPFEALKLATSLRCAAINMKKLSSLHCQMKLVQSPGSCAFMIQSFDCVHMHAASGNLHYVNHTR